MRCYTELDARLKTAAERTVLAHLLKLQARAGRCGTVRVGARLMFGGGLALGRAGDPPP
ncbi:MAG: hypothetical protein WDN04_09640 [Rhodospirillales bacterium]